MVRGCGGGGCWYTEEGELEDGAAEEEATLWKAEVFPGAPIVRLGGKGGGGSLGSLISYLKLRENALDNVTMTIPL